jgi:hypothetical protein
MAAFRNRTSSPLLFSVGHSGEARESTAAAPASHPAVPLPLSLSNRLSSVTSLLIPRTFRGISEMDPLSLSAAIAPPRIRQHKSMQGRDSTGADATEDGAAFTPKWGRTRRQISMRQGATVEIRMPAGEAGRADTAARKRTNADGVDLAGRAPARGCAPPLYGSWTRD